MADFILAVIIGKYSKKFPQYQLYTPHTHSTHSTSPHIDPCQTAENNHDTIITHAGRSIPPRPPQCTYTYTRWFSFLDNIDHELTVRKFIIKAAEHPNCPDQSINLSVSQCLRPVEGYLIQVGVGDVASLQSEDSLVFVLWRGGLFLLIDRISQKSSHIFKWLVMRFFKKKKRSLADRFCQGIVRHWQHSVLICSVKRFSQKKKKHVKRFCCVVVS